MSWGRVAITIGDNGEEVIEYRESSTDEQHFECSRCTGSVNGPEGHDMAECNYQREQNFADNDYDPRK